MILLTIVLIFVAMFTLGLAPFPDEKKLLIFWILTTLWSVRTGFMSPTADERTLGWIGIPVILIGAYVGLMRLQGKRQPAA